MWLETLFRKRRAQVSTVTVVDSDDRFRLYQLLRALIGKGLDTYVYTVRGLFSVEVNGSISLNPVRSEFGLTTTLEEALQTANRNFIEKAKKAYVFIPPERNRTLDAYLKDWAMDDRVYEKHGFAIVFGGKHLVGEDVLRLAIHVDVPPSTEEERKSILESTGFPYEKEAIAAGAGMTLHEFEGAAVESFYLYGKITAAHISAAKAEIVKKEGIMEIENPQFGFEAIGGYDYVKDFARNYIIRVLREKERAEKLGLRPPRGLLLFGPPGTGKTVFARALAKELQIPFLRLKTENIVSRWYGETERLTSRAIKLAEAIAPCVVFVDEIDRFGARSEDQHEVTKRTFSILLEWLGDENRKSIIVGTTNVPEQLDEAFVRVGRFDYAVPVLYPDREARRQILEVHTKVKRKVPLEDDYFLDEIAEMTEGFSGAEIEELVIRAARNAFVKDRDTVSFEDFNEALESFRIDAGQREETTRKYVELAARFCNDRTLLPS